MHSHRLIRSRLISDANRCNKPIIMILLGWEGGWCGNISTVISNRSVNSLDQLNAIVSTVLYRSFMICECRYVGVVLDLIVSSGDVLYHRRALVMFDLKNNKSFGGRFEFFDGSLQHVWITCAQQSILRIALGVLVS